MLTTCPECGLQVSDKAFACPHCGFPFKPEHARRSNRKKRLPNGFGQIAELKGRNLRKPFRAMVTIGTAENGRPICKLLKPRAYFETYNEAYQALMNYNANGYSPAKETTFKELYDEWSVIYFRDISDNAIAAHKAAWIYLSPIYSERVVEMKIKKLREVVENANKGSKEASSNTKKNIKILLNLLYDYAVENEIVDKNYARSFNLSKNITKEAAKAEKEHIAFTNEERNIMWKNRDKNYVDMLLINCYTGFRPYELTQIKLVDVDLTNWSITGGMKTEAGTNRIVPVHTAIRGLIAAKYNLAKACGSEYLFYDLDSKKQLTQKQHKLRFDTVVNIIGLNPAHRPHDCRKDFVTMAKKYKVDEYAIKRIVGHSIKDITEKIYTERDLGWLHEEIEKIRVDEF